MFLTRIIMLLCALWVVGCLKESSAPVTAPPQELLTYKPKGTITGIIKDGCTNAAITGAVLSVGFDGNVQSTTSDAAGAFSFANVPAGQFRVTGGGLVATGTYTVTASLVAYNASQPDANKHYRDFYYNTVTITFTSLVPGDSLGVSGLVGSIVYTISNLNTILTGLVVDQNMHPIANSSVRLFDLSVTPNVVIAQTTTTASGTYQFARVDNGITVKIRAQSQDGALEGGLASFVLPCNQTYDSLRSQVQLERVMLAPADNVAPFVISINPPNNADVAPTGLQVVYTFSEPIKQVPYTRTDLGFGHGTIIDDITINYNGMKKVTGAIPFTAEWDSTYTKLTVTPQGVVGSAKYSIDIHLTLPKLKDLAGNAVVDNLNLTGDGDALSFTTNGSSPVPVAPILARRSNPGTYDPVNFNGGKVGLEWNYDANARSYNIYRSVGDGSFELLQRDLGNLQFETNTDSLVFPLGATDPLRAISVRYQVRAVSKDLVEGAGSDTITVTDKVKPEVNWAFISVDSITSNALLNNVYYITIPFSEPLDILSAESNASTKYVFSNTLTPLTTTNADYLGSKPGPNGYYVRLTVTSQPVLQQAPLLTVDPSVRDLSGNALDSAKSANTHQFPFLVPTVSSISPTIAVAGGTGFTLTVTGSNFTTSSVVRWNGLDRPTTVLGTTEVTAAIPASDIATGGTANVTVFNPSPGGGTSNVSTFTINFPVPSVSSLSPASATAGGGAFTLTVNGSNFFTGSTVLRWNGANRTTTVLSATQLTASIPASDIPTAGTARVTVFNPLPGGGLSNSVIFTSNESFEATWTNGATTPSGWSRTLVVGASNWARGSNPLVGQSPPAGTAAEDGISVARFAANVALGNTTRIESPSYDLSQSASPNLQFYYVNTSGTDVLNVQISTSGGAWTTLVTLGTTTSNAWELQTISLSSVAGQSNVRIGFEAVADGGTSDIWLDNVIVQP